MIKTINIISRIWKQLIKDRRYLALTALAPLIAIIFLKVTLDALSPAASPASSEDKFIMPIIAALVFFFAYLLCTLSLVQERTQETLSRMFVVGYKRWHIIIAYLTSFALLSTIQTFLVFGEAYYIFNLNFSLEKIVSLFIVVWLLSVIAVALGILVSNFARNEQQVFPFIPLVLLPTVFLSGILTQGVDKYPDWARYISYLIPLRYANNIIKGLISGVGITSYGNDLIVLGLIGLGTLILAIFSLRRLN